MLLLWRSAIMILKLKRTPGIYLVGFMGCGKSTIGRALADEIGWRFLDLDEEIEKAEKCPISEIFEQRGEPADPGKAAYVDGDTGRHFARGGDGFS